MKKDRLLRVSHRVSSCVRYFLVSVGGFVMLFPFLWMIATSFKTPDTWYSLSLLPKSVTLENYELVMGADMVPLYYRNTLILAVLGTLSVAVFSSITGYGFAKHKFPGRELLFTLVLATIMIPGQITVIPWYVLIVKLGWGDSYQGILAPSLVSAFGVFLMRQFIAGIPDELIDAGRIDGVSEFGLFWRICLPLARPALSVLCIFTFLGQWNSFLWPLIVINSKELLTLQIGLANISLTLEAEHGTLQGVKWGPALAGATVAAIPMLIVFSIFQKQIVKGVALSGMKG